jgi:hypothetical protein
MPRIFIIRDRVTHLEVGRIQVGARDTYTFVNAEPRRDTWRNKITRTDALLLLHDMLRERDVEAI